MFEFIDSVDVGNTLGEGVIWDLSTQQVWWTDIEQCRLYAYHPETSGLRTFEVPHRLCAFALTSHPDTLLAAFDQGIALYSLRSGNSHWLFRFPDGASVRFNDGRVDPEGRFWVGTVNDEGDRTASSGLYCVSHDCTVRRIESEVGICNGLAWNTGATRFFMSDSARQTIYAYDYDRSSGAISDKTRFVQLEATAAPDGAIIDTQDSLWSALWGAGSLARFTPTGQQQRHQVPVSQPTCVAFGGPANNLLFVTTARYGLSDTALAQEPLAGSLLVYRTDETGAPATRFQGAAQDAE